jgi:hypothetical protein
MKDENPDILAKKVLLTSLWNMPVSLSNSTDKHKSE